MQKIQLTWLRKNLFNSWYNSLLTILCLLLIIQFIRKFVWWTIAEAQWQVVQVNLPLFLVGRFPQTSYWRLWIVLGIITFLIVITWSVFITQKNLIKHKFINLLVPWLAPTWLLSCPLILWFMGGGLGLQSISTNLWNGLILTLLMAVISIVISFPLGILLALGRTSNLFIIRWFSILYIEIIRGLPLIGILFIAQVMLPLFLPTELRLDRLIRGIAGLVLFSTAYMAENVRGGLQSIPREQIEAAKALGLPTPLVIILVVLPQALRAVIPAIVGQFIGLLKDTSLLSLVGLVELTGMSRSILAQPQFIGRYAEVYIFVGLLYWVFCYSMSLASRRLEKQLIN
ncbi:amino acid ABC transporter permease [Pleurocapsa sp. CCALA 161]|uniref:amino acid ABC transporter permease n=1 Tax=Pleurocapsa sp. CCALA 161 TaxID=2107688 RepID=UPI000D0610DE|nr:amino acid ABC transporter permease [Pleurocapsa sp. CCALA 161]PSB12708.1 amino acid ABC transporter permease [Pleurocapsa sp. CCALA 161]